jgi:tetratricopeptide (TPR) repeat protein
MFNWSSAKIRLALVPLTVLQLAGCGSAEDRARSYYERGLKFVSEHDNKRAAIELRNAVKLKRDLIEAWAALAKIDELDRNWAGVLTDLRAVVELNPSDVAARLKLVKLRLLAGSLGDAVGLVNSGIEVNPESADIHALKAAILFKLDDHTGAAREAQTALELDPANVDAIIVVAADRLAGGDTEAALSLLDSNVGTEAQNSEKGLWIQLLKAKIFVQSGNLKGAEDALEKLVRLKPDDAGFRKLLIKFYIDQHRPDKAEREMRALTAANPSDAKAVLDVVHFLYEVRNNPAAAREELVGRIKAGGDVFTYQIALADMDFAESNYVGARRLLESLINSETLLDRTLAAKIKLGQMELGRNNPDAAAALVSEILSKDRRNVAGLRLRASIHLGRAQPEAAVADLSEALNYQPRSTDLMALLATAYERSGLLELAEKQYADALRTSNFDVGVGLEYSAFLQRRGGAGAAEAVLNELRDRQPKNVQVLAALAQIRLARQNWTGAREIAESIRRLGDDDRTADQILGAALLGLKKYDESIAAFRSAYNTTLAKTEAMNSLILAFLTSGKRDQAMGFLKSVLEKEPKNANALLLLGSVQLASNAPDQALQSFAAAVKEQPKNVAGYQALAEFYVSQKSYDDAIEVIRTGIKEQPDLVALHLIFAGLLERKGNYDAAISEYEIILNKEPDNFVVVNNLASLLLDHCTDEASLNRAGSLAAALRKSPIPQFKDTLGWARYRQREFKAAVSLLEEAVADLPGESSVHYHLGAGYISIGQFAKASDQLRIALDLAPSGELAEHVVAALKKADLHTALGQSGEALVHR